MIDAINVMEKQFSYINKVLTARKEHFQESFEKPLFEGEQSAAEVYTHGITTTFRYCRKIIDNKTGESAAFEPDIELEDPNKYLNLYEKTLHLLREVQQQSTEEDLNREVATFNSKTLMPLREWLSLNIMHTVAHVGQALRLQSLYIKHKLDT